MSWKTSQESYVVKRPRLDEMVGNDNGEFSAGLEVYGRWCSQLLTVRTTSIAISFFVSGVVSVYLLNLPLYLFGLNDVDFLSLSGLWSVTCIVSLWTGFLWFRCRNGLRTATNPAPWWLPFGGADAIGARGARWWWSPMVRVVIYPLLSLSTTSFFLSWIGVPFSSLIASSAASDGADDSDLDSTANLLINYSVLWLSYIYGYFPDVVYHRNTLYFKALQPNRGIFVKQTLIRALVSNFVQTLAFCAGTLSICWMMHLSFWDLSLSLACSWRIFGTLWRVTFTLNFLWIASYLLLNRLLTEKEDMSRFNGAQFPLIPGTSASSSSSAARCVDVRMMALTKQPQSGSSAAADCRKDYFFNLALFELLDVVRYDAKQRKLLFGTSKYFQLLKEALLAELTAFITSTYRFLYGPRRRSDPRSDSQRGYLWTTCCGAYFYRAFVLEPEMRALFANWQSLVCAADILSFLVLHSLEDDDLGIVQEALEQIMAVLLEALDILDIFHESRAFAECCGQRALRRQRNGVTNALYKGIETAVMRIVRSMHSHLAALKLPDKNAKRLRTYL